MKLVVDGGKKRYLLHQKVERLRVSIVDKRDTTYSHCLKVKVISYGDCNVLDYW